MSQIYKSFTEEKFQVIYPVEPKYDGSRLDQFLMSYFENFSRQAIKRKIEKGEVKINNRPFPHKPSVKVYHGENVEIVTYNEGLEEEYWRGINLILQKPTIIFEDEDLLVINKPPYMATHPTGKHLFNCATIFYQAKYGHTVHSIHRLDRETSGILVLGKNPRITREVTAMFEKSLVHKCYLMIAHKNKNAKTMPFTANQNMGTRDNYLPNNYVHCYEDNQGKTAQTQYKELMSYGDYTIALAFPKTGRQHQIRAHAAYHGYPLLGDKMYNGDPRIFMRFKDEIPTKEDHDIMQISRHALHAVGLRLQGHSKYKTPFRANIPNDLADWLEVNMYTDINELEKLIEKEINLHFLN